jgi:hypothetical protein
MPTDTQTHSDHHDDPTAGPDPTSLTGASDTTGPAGASDTTSPTGGSDTTDWAGSRGSGNRPGRPTRLSARRDDRGQATSEYGLVILVAAGIAFGVISWAGHTDAFTRLFDSVVRHLTSHM